MIEALHTNTVHNNVNQSANKPQHWRQHVGKPLETAVQSASVQLSLSLSFTLSKLTLKYGDCACAYIQRTSIVLSRGNHMNKFKVQTNGRTGLVTYGYPEVHIAALTLLCCWVTLGNRNLGSYKK